MRELNIKLKTVKLLEENMGEKFCDWVGKDLLASILKDVIQKLVNCTS